MPTPLYPIAPDFPTVSEKYTNLDTDDARAEANIAAERLLRLSSPAYTGVSGETITRAVVRQINFMLEQDLEPMVLKSISNDNPGNVTAYRDRYVDPAASDMVDGATGRQFVRFRPAGRGA